MKRAVIFLLRSAYHAYLFHKDVHKPGPSRFTNQKLWHDTWRAPILNITQNFLWRVAKNILPTKGNLSRKGICIDPIFPFRFAVIQFSLHIFMKCFIVRQALFSSPLSYRIPAKLDINAWCAINALVFQQKSCSLIVMAFNALARVQDFIRENPVSIRHQPVNHSLESFPADVHIAQVDVGLSREGFVVFGCIFKNHRREITLAASKKEYIDVDLGLAELLALRWCITMAMELKLDRVIFQSDALSVVDCINSLLCNESLSPLRQSIGICSINFLLVLLFS